MPNPSASLPAGTALDLLTDSDLLARFRQGAEGSDDRVAAFDLLVRRFTPLVRACVRPYRNSPEGTDDLMQVAFLGLVKAIRRFDPGFGNELRAYAAPCINGELKRHFRDRRWQVRVTRPLQELLLEMRSAAEDLTSDLGHTPTDAELAERLGVTLEDLGQARQAAGGFAALSLDAPVGDSADAADLGELLGGDDAAFDLTTDMQAVEQHWDELPRREQQILIMRFYGNHTQEEVAAHLGISQMHVSRLQARALSTLRERVNAETDPSSPAEGG